MKEWPFGDWIKEERWNSLTKAEQQAVLSAAVDKLFEIVEKRTEPSRKQQANGAQ